MGIYENSRAAILQILEERGGARQLADKSGVDTSVLSRLKNDARGGNFKTVATLLDALGATLVFPGQTETTLEDPVHDYVFVPMVKAVADAGPGSWEDSGETLKELAFRRDWLQRKTLNVDNLRVWRVRGDSMEPVIAEGGVALIDEGSTQLERGKIYVARLRGELFIKEYGGRDVGRDVWVSKNPKYSPMYVEEEAGEDYEIIGKVLFSGREL